MYYGLTQLNVAVNLMNIQGDFNMSDQEQTITRAHLAEFVYRKIGLSQSESAELVDLVLEEIASALNKGESVKLSSFGTFKVRQKKQRMGRNPKTKQEVPITPRKVITFHSSNILANRVNERVKGSSSGSNS